MPSKDFWSNVMYNKASGAQCSYPVGSVGIEVELEGLLSGENVPYHWRVTTEQSLRQCPHGYEYVLRKPLTDTRLDQALEQFDEMTAKFEIKPSIRCSTHMHVSVQGCTNGQVMSALALYMLVEELLISHQPKTRIGNLFCRRVSDAEAIPIALVGMIMASKTSEQYSWDYFHNNGWKYGAVNLSAIFNYGSIEFRFMQAMWKKEDLAFWARVLSALVEYGVSHPIDSWMKDYNDLPVKNFLTKIFGNDTPKLTGDLTNYQLNYFLHTNYSFIIDISYAMKNNKFRSSNHFINSMSDTTPGYFDDGPYDAPQPMPKFTTSAPKFSTKWKSAPAEAADNF